MKRIPSNSVHEKLNTFLSSITLSATTTTSSSSILHFNPGISELVVRASSGALEFRQHPKMKGPDNNEHGYISELKEYLSRFNQLFVDHISFGTHFCVFTCKDSSNIFACGLQNIYKQHDNNKHDLQKDEVKEWIQLIATNQLDGKINKISVGEMHCLLLTENGNVYSLGRGTSGELGLGSLITWQEVPTLIKIGKIITDISAGSHYSIFVSSDGSVYTCGNAAYCRLGQSNDENNSSINDDDILIPTLVESLQGVHVTRCYAGTWHSMVVVDSTADVFVWGWNKFGQLGLGFLEGKDIIPNPLRLSCFDFLLHIKDKKGQDFDYKIHDIVLGSFCSLITVILSNGNSCVFVFGIDQNDNSIFRLPFDFDGISNKNDHENQHEFTDVLYHLPMLELPVYMNVTEPNDQIIVLW